MGDMRAWLIEGVAGMRLGFVLGKRLTSNDPSSTDLEPHKRATAPATLDRGYAWTIDRRWGSTRGPSMRECACGHFGAVRRTGPPDGAVTIP